MSFLSPPSKALPDEAPDPASLPRHLAVIMDGNGRWATQRGLPRTEGHRAGTEAARAIVEECLDLGIAHLTLYTFSRENWSRPASEVRFLFDLLVDFITRKLPDLEKRGVKLLVLGEADELPFTARKALGHAMTRTSNNSRMILNLALNYSGREEIVRAVKQYAASGAPPESLTPELLARHLYTAGQPDPDLIIRTSGEERMSNFLIFQSAYSELYFIDALWPDFTPLALREALAVYAGRNRRFGGLHNGASPNE